MELSFVSRKKYDNVVHKLECLLCHATGNRLSKHTYDLRTMESAVTDYVERCCDEARAETKSEVDRLKKALAAKDAEYDQALQDKARECNMVIDMIRLENRANLALLNSSHEQELAKAKRDIARKVIAEVDLLISKYHLEPYYSVNDMEIDLAELEKKYTKGATDGKADCENGGIDV